MNLLQRYDNFIAKRITCNLEELGTPEPDEDDMFVEQIFESVESPTTTEDATFVDSVSQEQKEESMDALHSNICNCNPICSNAADSCQNKCSKNKDDGGYKTGHVQHFLDTYQEGDDIIQILRKDLISLLSDIHWIKETGNEHEQFSLDFADALNEISVMI